MLFLVMEIEKEKNEKEKIFIYFSMEIIGIAHRRDDFEKIEILPHYDCIHICFMWIFTFLFEDNFLFTSFNIIFDKHEKAKGSWFLLLWGSAYSITINHSYCIRLEKLKNFFIIFVWLENEQDEMFWSGYDGNLSFLIIFYV